MTPILEPLAPLRDNFLVLTGLDQRNAEAAPSENNGPHTRTTAAYLTGVHPKQTRGADYLLAPSVDQIAAKELGKHTQLASLEMALDTGYTSGVCEGEWSCVYANTLSWRTPTTPLPMENHPREVFERLFGDNDTTDSAARLARMQENRSLLDFVTQNVARLQKGLGPTDRAKLNEYLDAIRDVERRIQIAEEQASSDVPTLERPGGSIPAAFEDYIKLMFDMQVLAYQTDLTRISTFMIAHESSNRTYPQIGVPDPHHPLTHHRGLADMKAKVALINAYHVKMFGYLLDRLRSTPDGDGSLLDHSMLALRVRHQRRQLPYQRKSSSHFGGRRRREDQGRPSPQVPRGYAYDESVLNHAGQGGRSGRQDGRQHWKARPAFGFVRAAGITTSYYGRVGLLSAVRPREGPACHNPK